MGPRRRVGAPPRAYFARDSAKSLVYSHVAWDKCVRAPRSRLLSPAIIFHGGLYIYNIYNVTRTYTTSGHSSKLVDKAGIYREAWREFMIRLVLNIPATAAAYRDLRKTKILIKVCLSLCFTYFCTFPRGMERYMSEEGGSVTSRKPIGRLLSRRYVDYV